jgi:catechol 2,3-dioxygenase-like lactoylglutathione lyase family enzyme
MGTKLEAVHPVLMVRDVRASIAFYERLGFKLAFADTVSAPKYAGLRRDAVEIHLQWHDAATSSHPVDRPTYRFAVSDVDALFEEFSRLPALDASSVSDTP